MTVNVQNAPAGAKLDAWIDFNADGAWGGPFEQIADTLMVANGDNTITFDVPSWAVDGTTYARFRLSSAGDLGPAEPAGDGEVEDYLVVIASPLETIRSFGGENVISTASDYPQSVFAVDVDGDGDMDVLSASASDDTIAWYENDGSGGFTRQIISTAADSAKSVFAADVDGDGDMDVLSASSLDDKIAWYENLGLDFGDAPAPYSTLLADAGARHLATGPLLGSNRDAESDGQPTAAADGDDITGTPDDEDGLVNPAVDLSLVVGVVPSIAVKVANNTGSEATLYGWIDYNGDGVFEAGERASVAVPTGSTDLTVTLDNFPAVPSGSAANTYARFRFSTDPAAAQPTGAADDGEVEDYAVSIVSDVQSPQVTNVWVSSQSWAGSFLNYLQTSGVGDATHGYAVPVGSSDQLRTLPWFNIDEIAVQFSEDVNVSQTDLDLIGLTVAQYGYATPGFSYDNVNYVATWTLSQEIDEPDKLLIDLGGVTDTAGNPLDGEWTNGTATYPSGDGTPGGDFQFRFNILPGDVRQTGLVTSADWSAVRARVFQMPGGPEYSVFLDVDGSGLITSSNWSRTRSRVFDQLPSGEPGASLPTAPPEVLGDSWELDLAFALVLDRRTDRMVPCDNHPARAHWDEALLRVAHDLEQHKKGTKQEVPGTSPVRFGDGSPSGAFGSSPASTFRHGSKR